MIAVEMHAPSRSPRLPTTRELNETPSYGVDKKKKELSFETTARRLIDGYNITNNKTRFKNI